MNSIIGKKKKNQKGEIMTVVAYHKGRIDIKFEDGSRRNCIRVEQFKQGKVLNPKHFIGEIRKNRIGQEVCIIKFRNWNSIDVQFPDGTLRKRVNYLNFRAGRVFSIREQLNAESIGELRPNFNGEWMYLISFRNPCDIDVRFKDGTIRGSVDYYQFETGHIFRVHKAMKLNRIGESSTTRNGEKMVIVAYRRCDDLDVQFSDGSVKKGVSYHNFKKGSVCKPV